MSEVSENCNHDCNSCGEDCSSRSQDFHKPLNEVSSVKKVIGVISGKGGVGKSMVTSMLAAAAAKAGRHTAILDADVTGPSIPKVFGIEEKAKSDGNFLYPAQSKVYGIEMMSTNLILDRETDPVIWRGPVISGVVSQFWTDVVWNDIDVMFVDMPPGTGDVALTVFQSLPVDGIVIVTSPQQLVSMIVEKAVHMAEMMHIPILDIVENMSYFRCPDCQKEHSVFGESRIDGLAAKFHMNRAVRLPLDMKLVQAADAGAIESYDGEALQRLGEAFKDIW